jgi:hypothetical protein
MRHLYGVAFAVAMAAAVFFAASWGYLRLLRLPAGALPANGGSLIHNHAVLEGFGVLLGVGLLAGLLMVIAWVSPLASGLPGLVLLAWSGLYLFDVKDAVRYIPLKNYDYGAGFEALLFDGVLAAVGIAMIIPLFVPSRWIRRARTVPAVAATGLADGSISELIETYPTETYTTEAYPQPLGFTTPSSPAETVVDGGAMTDWSQTRPQAQIDPGPSLPPKSQAPWGPADFSS